MLFFVKTILELLFLAVVIVILCAVVSSYFNDPCDMD